MICPVCLNHTERHRCACGVTLETRDGRVDRARRNGQVVWMRRANHQLELEHLHGETRTRIYRLEDQWIPIGWSGASLR